MFQNGEQNLSLASRGKFQRKLFSLCQVENARRMSVMSDLSRNEHIELAKIKLYELCHFSISIKKNKK